MRRFFKPVLVTVGAAAAAFIIANPGAPLNPTPARSTAKTFCPAPEAAAKKPKANTFVLPTLPSIPTPSIPSIPCIPLPTLPAPELPKITLPTVTLPTVTLPTVTLPTIVIPPIPAIGFPGYPDPCNLGQAAAEC